MEKLARTLGENVPPELVFPNLLSAEHSLPPPVSQETRKSSRVSRGRSWSVDTEASSAELLRNHFSSSQSRVITPSIRSTSHSHLHNPSVDSLHTFNTSTSSIQTRPDSIAFSTTCNRSEMNQVYGSGFVAAAPSFAGGIQIDRTLSSTGSLSSLQSLQPQKVKRRPSITQMISRSASVRLRSNTVTGKKDNEGAGKRKEKGWSGEWNQEDMDQVVNKLRNLKAK